MSSVDIKASWSSSKLLYSTIVNALSDLGYQFSELSEVGCHHPYEEPFR